MSKVTRRQSLQSLASLFMLGGTVGTVGYINRKELAEWLPAPRRPEWTASVMILTAVHPEGVTRDQAIAMNSTEVKAACDLASLKYQRVNFSDDLEAKDRQYKEMREMLDEEGPYQVITVSDKGVVKIHKAPNSLNEMLNLVNKVNK